MAQDLNVDLVAARRAQYKPQKRLDARIAAIRSKNEHRATARQLAIYDRACAALDRLLVATLQNRFAAEAVDYDPLGPIKYLDMPVWIWNKVGIAERLDIDRSGPRAILDLGMGAGHFALICRAFGHDVAGIDLNEEIYDPDRAVYVEVCRTLGLDRVDHRILAGRPLPDIGRRFDVVTAFQTTFNMYWEGGHRRYWRTQEWRWFFADLNRHLRPGATVFLDINPMKLRSGELLGHDEFTELCRQSGGEVVVPGRSVLFRTTDGIALAG